MFAPLYLSDYCINKCSYCGYNRENLFNRRKLSQEELAEEVDDGRVFHKGVDVEAELATLQQEHTKKTRK